MTFVLILILGAAAGFLATRFMRVQTDVITTVLLGVAGAGLSWIILSLLARIAGLGLMFAGAVIGAMAMIWLWQMFRR